MFNVTRKGYEVADILDAAIKKGTRAFNDSDLLQNTIYSKHNISFQIPAGWSVVKDVQEENDTQIVLSDGANAIRVDLIKHSGIGKIIGDYLTHSVSKSELDSLDHNPKDTNNDAWHTMYERYPWYSNEAICDYYMEKVIRPIALAGSNSRGSGISVTPDGVEYAGVSTNSGSIQHHILG